MIPRISRRRAKPPRRSAAAPLMLDLVPGASVAMSSTHKLRTAYTGGPYRAKRDDGPTQEIAFSSDVPDYASIVTFAATRATAVDIWHDQGLVGRDYSAPSYFNSPRLYDGSALATMANGKKSFAWNGNNALLYPDPLGLSGAAEITVAWSFEMSSDDTWVWSVGNTVGNHSIYCDPYSPGKLRVAFNGAGTDWASANFSVPHSYIAYLPAGATRAGLTQEVDGVAMTGTLIGSGSNTAALSGESSLGWFSSGIAQSTMKLNFFAVWPRALSPAELAIVRAEQATWHA